MLTKRREHSRRLTGAWISPQSCGLYSWAVSSANPEFAWSETNSPSVDLPFETLLARHP